MIGMSHNPDLHHRHSIRLKDYDYSRDGAYFVTICTWQRECLFGEIVDGELVLNEMGRVVQAEWERTEKVRENIVLDEYVVMPNHFHGIVFIANSVGAMPMARTDATGNQTGILSVHPQVRATHRGAPTGPAAGSIGAVLAQFKSIVTKQINILRNNPGCPVWQRNYYERVIRNGNELSRAREYIVNNPMKWELDRENPINTR